MKNFNIVVVIVGLTVAALLGGYYGALNVAPVRVSLAAQYQVEQITESLAGLWQKIGAGLDWNVGIGTKTPSEKLSVAGTIESLSGGFKFPDGTIQQTAQLVGPQGPPGPQGPVGLSLKVLDANGVEVGFLLGDSYQPPGSNNMEFSIFDTNYQAVGRFDFYTGILSSVHYVIDNVGFDQDGCTGQLYIENLENPYLFDYLLAGTDLAGWYVGNKSISVITNIQIKSRLQSNNYCNEQDLTFATATAVNPVNLSYVPPFTISVQ